MSQMPPEYPPGYQAPGGPTYDPPPGLTPPGGTPGGGGRRNRETPLLLALLVLVVGIIVVGGLLVFGGDDDDGGGGGEGEETEQTSSRTPEETLLGYYDALHNRDCEAWVDHVDEATWSQDGATNADEAVTHCEERMTQMALDYAGTTPVNARTVFDDGQTAKVRYDEEQDAGSFSLVVDLVLEDGKWRVTGNVDFA